MLKLDRLLSITMALLNTKRVGAAELAERFEVSLRTIYRDMESINQAGIPIASFAGQDGGYEIMEGYRLERQSLSLDDFASIYSALRGIQSAADNQDVAGLLDRIGALIPAKSDQKAALSMDLQWLSTPAEKEKIRLLHATIKENRLLSFEYMDFHGQETRRTIEPMAIYIKGYAWYVWGYCLTRLDLRVFRLSRINHLQQLQETFIRRNMELEDSPNKWVQQDAEPQVETVLRFKASMKTRVRDVFDPSQIEVEEDGSMKVTARYFTKEAVLKQVLSYGTEVKLIEPQEMVFQLRNHLAAISRLYDE
ncbi:putative DNA-binding transcriptional regulator YafY [Paenibacillus prosopidis]|uniref:Putative DNA-binding transcriptional regulator YafY n=1 Tax=Paenibacillus prosopidis TaxID=630520 RepID=A0A368W7A6_9BACL|nr:putative DNA-binding transcriptional regulator YafY [Paenibacillus prosopidis]